MTWPEPTSMQVPLRCFGLEHNGADPVCQQCPHKVECVRYHGTRAGKISLSKARFNLTPKMLEEKYKMNLEDPELPHIQRTYCNCFETVFGKGKQPVDSVISMAQKLVEAARRCECSLRLYMLANMVGHQRGEEIQIDRTNRGTPRTFKAKVMLTMQGQKRAKMFAELCRKEFGTFSLSTLSTLAGEDFEEDTLEKSMLHSETTVGKFIIGYKIFHGGWPWPALFDKTELTLDPQWLAIDKTYVREIYEPYLSEKHGTERIKQHRFSVSQVMGFLKKHKHAATNAFKMREQIMPKAIADALTMFGHSPDDFEIDDVPIDDPLPFWVFLGRAVQHWQCLRYIDGQPSLLDR